MEGEGEGGQAEENRLSEDSKGGERGGSQEA